MFKCRSAIYRLSVYSGTFQLLEYTSYYLHDCNAVVDYLQSNVYGKARAVIYKVFAYGDFVYSELISDRQIIQKNELKEPEQLPFPLTMAFKRSRRYRRQEILRSYGCHKLASQQ